jgi:hypothetical protein
MKSIIFAVAIVVDAALILAGCSGGGRTRVSYGVGVEYGGYPIIPDIPDGPSASQMLDFGTPDAGMMDMGGFDF